MDSRIELQLEKTVVVLGPSVTTCLLNDTSELPPLTFESIRSTLFGDASSGSETDQLASRLQKTFPLAEAKETTAGNSPATVVEQLLDLQRSGALLAYLYPDTVVDRALGLASFSAVDVKKWVDHAQGIMHLYGVHTDVDSVQCMQDEKPIVTDSLLDVVKDKLCVCLGFDGDAEVQRDLHCFASQVPCDREAKQPRILLPCEKVFDTVRSLPVPITGNCCEALCPVGDTSKAIGAMVEHHWSDLTQPISLLMASKTDYVKTAKMLSSFPGVNLQLMNSMEYSGLSFHILTLDVDREKFYQFWYALMQPSSVQLLVKYTVLAVVLDRSTFIWLSRGKRTAKVSAAPLTLGELMSSSTNVSTAAGVATGSGSIQAPPLSFSMSSVLKQNRIHPRYTVKKQKVDSKQLLNENAASVSPSSSVLKRRFSLPHHAIMAALPTSTSSQQQQQNVKTASTNSLQTSRQQFLLSKYLMNRRTEQPLAKPEPKTLHQLLKSELKEFPKPSPKAVKYISDWITDKRRSLFVSETREWSSIVSQDLERKTAKWRRIRERRLNHLKKKRDEAAQQERLRRVSMDSNSSSSSDVIRQHLSSAAAPPMGGAMINTNLPSSLLTTVNPYILPQTANFALRAASMMYPPSYLSSYPLLTPLPVPYLLPNAPSNLVLVSSSSLGTSTATVSSATGGIKNPSIVPLSAPFISSTPSPVSTGVSPRLAQPLLTKRKHSNSEKPYSEISSLLMKKDTDLPLSKQSRMISSPASLSDEKSDGEEESTSEHMSCDSSETEENQLPLWKFMLELLLSNSYSQLIDWSQIHSLEFQVKQPKEVAKLWSSYKSDRSIDYSRFRKALQYYCTKEQPILNSVSGKEEVYRFSSSMLYYINNRYSQLQRNELSVLNSSNLERSREICGSQEVLVVD